ncbi:hypothetical protein N24_2958 [Corynebacterium suranareeae]|uniref:Uncharacterized protein n=1 Tax=Corynebacterium suranareeae TaxID=2506452 RepID=A0A161JPK1_9CORY|nr:hypothetical protein [Corynebacterium suranareeae]BAU97220.1 hypothetical protein N24_2958 [Corynebacterium suranareeae]
MSTTITVFSPTHSPAQIREIILSAAKEDDVDFLGVPFTHPRNVTIEIDDDLINDCLGWLDDVALASGLGIQYDDEILRYGDEDIAFTTQTKGDDDARIGASRLGLEHLLNSIADDDDYLKIAQFDIENPADESTYISARSLSEVDGWTLEFGVAGVRNTTIVASTDDAITTMLRWMNGEDIRDLNWTRV